jgi:hypothetical protein
MSVLRLVAVWSVFCAIVHSADDSTNSTNSTSGTESDQPLCGSTLDQANGVREHARVEQISQLVCVTNMTVQTGFFPFSLSTLIPSRDPPPKLTWGVSLLGGVPRETTASYSFWLDTGGANYSDSLNLGYDVCAIYMDPYGIRDNTDSRAKYDNGTCLDAFDAYCVQAFMDQSNDLALQLVGSPTPLPNSNLTVDSLPGVCDTIAQRMASALPKECKPYFYEGRYLMVSLLRWNTLTMFQYAPLVL